jgi:O-antigen ligase
MCDTDFSLTNASARVPPLVQPVVLALLGLASLGLNFRSHALVCLLASATLLTSRVLGSRIRRGWQFAGIIGFGLVFAYVMPIAARVGVFGPALQRKTFEQDATNLPMLLAGRTEPPMTITAILERPFLGWGSAKNLTPELYTQAEHLAIRMGFDPTFPFDLYWRLPPSDYSAMHSILLGSWAEGGVLAVLLPAWLLVACLGIVWNNVRFGVWAPLAVTVALQGIWDLIYAPWTYNTLAEYACIALLFCAVHFRGPASQQPTPP